MNTLAITPYSGSDDPRGRSPKYLKDPAAFYAKWSADILALPPDRRPKRVIVQRAAGMDPMHRTHSWAIDDYRDLTHAERDILATFCLSMDREGIVCALCVGSRIDDAGEWRRADWDYSQDRAIVTRTVENAKRLGFTELWIDTGGDIDGIDNVISRGTLSGVVVIPEYHRSMAFYHGPVYVRCRRKQTDDENVSLVSHDGPLSRARRCRMRRGPQGGKLMGMVHTRIAGLFVLLATLAGCSGQPTTTEIRREPAKARFLEIDTRPVPQTNPRGSPPQVAPETPQVCHPIARAIAIAAIAAVDAPKPQPIVIDPDGRVTLPESFTGVLRLGDAEGDKPQIKTPDGGGAFSTAMSFISSTTRVPAKGAPMLLWGAGIMALGVAAWVFGAGKKIALPVIAFGAVVFGAGWVITYAPWVVGILIAGAVGLGVYWVWVTRQGRDAEAAVETTAPVVEDSPRIILAELTALLPDANGNTLAEAANRAAARIKGAIGAKAKAKPKTEAKVDRAVKRAKKATGTATAFRGS